MLPIGPLMAEHRLIEQIVPLLINEVEKISKYGKLDLDFIKTAVDFFRTYADRCHHGKEEDILFLELNKKPLSREHKKILDDLVKDHVVARETVGLLLKSAMDEKAEVVIQQLKKLIDLYPEHIRIEDKVFFLPSMEYFSKEEQDKMLSGMDEFDRNLIHEKYGNIVLELKKRK